MSRRSAYRQAPLAMLICSVGVVLWPFAAAGQYCDLTFEGFRSFGGPANFDNGTYRVEWCVNGAQISSSQFCSTGNVLRMSSSSQDPIIWVYVGDAGCTSVKLQFDFGAFAATGTVLKYATSSDTSLNCSAAINEYAGSIDLTDGICHTAEHIVTLGPNDRSVYWKFDHGLPSSNAIYLDNVYVALETCDCNGAQPAHGCCETGGPGCEDPAVESCVCAQDSYCCTTEWDAPCVAEVDSFGCGSCGSACATEFSIDFGNFFQSGLVCSIWPALFETCTTVGPWITSGTACGGTGDYAMNFGTGFPYSSAVTRCLDLSGPAAASLQFFYTKSSGLGPRVEVSVDGGNNFATLWEAPFSFPGGCQAECVDLADYLGESDVRFRFSSGSSTANGAAFDDIQLVLGSGCATCSYPAADAGPDQVLCPGESVKLAGSASGGSGGSCPSDYSPTWAGLGVVSGGDTFAPTVDAPGQYFLTVGCDVCLAQDTVFVALDDAIPTVDAGATVSLPCDGGVVQLDGSVSGCPTGSAVSWTASSGGNIVAGADTLTPIVDAAGIYTLHASCTGGCAGEDSVHVIERLPGDWDGNGMVRLDDFAEFAACLAGPGGGLWSECACGDFESDSDVDLIDFGRFQVGFGAETTVTGACCAADGACTQETESACLAGGGVYHGDGDECGTVICPSGRYRNKVAPITDFFGNGDTLADDMTLSGIGARELVYYDLAVYGGASGGGPFDVTVALYTDCPGAGGTVIAGTTSTFTGVPDDEYVYTLSADLSGAPVAIPDSVWMAVSFSTAQAGWIVAGAAEAGFTADQFAVGSDPADCGNAFGGDNPPYGGFWANLRCTPAGGSRAATTALQTTITRWGPLPRR